MTHRLEMREKFADEYRAVTPPSSSFVLEGCMIRGRLMLPETEGNSPVERSHAATPYCVR
jgi:hypothetical protein